MCTMWWREPFLTSAMARAAPAHHLREENRVLKTQLRGKRVRLTDDDRRRLAVLGARLGRRILAEVATL
jgi:hypothetical protein